MTVFNFSFFLFCFYRVKIIQYESMWVYTEEFAESVKPRGELSNNMGEIAISYINHHHKKDKKIVFLYLVARFLLDGNLQKKFIKDEFVREKQMEKLSCQELVSDIKFGYSKILF